ncbi:imm11 family protein, partial [Acinetobacter baumannii]
MYSVWKADFDNEIYYTRGTIRDISVLKEIKLTKGEPISDRNIKIDIDLIEEYEPADYFHVGSLFIVSSKLKDILETKQVSAEYLPIKLYKPNGIPIQNKYFFVNLLKKI